MEFKRIGIVFVILTILLSFGAAYLFLDMVQTAQQSTGELVRIVTVENDFAAYTTLTKDKLDYTEVPRKYVQGSFIKNEKDVIGKVLLIPLKKGDVITTSMIRQVEQLPKDVRVLQLRPPIIFDTQKLVPGDRVDLIGTFSENGQISTRLILSGAVVHEVKNDEKTESIGSVCVRLEIPAIVNLVTDLNKAKEVRLLKQNYIEGQSA